MSANVINATQQELRNRRGILAVLGSAGAIFFPGSLVFGFPGLMGPVWREMLAIESGALSYTMFFMLASLGIFMFFVGKWTMSLGVRKLMIIGTFLASAATIMVTFATNLIMVYVWAFLVGASSCFIYSPGINTVQRWFPQKRGLVSGIVNLTFGISAAAMVPIYRIMLESLGYKALCLIVAVITIIIGLIASQFTEMPEKVKGFQLANTTNKETKPVAEPLSFTPQEATKTKSFWLIWAIWALMGAAGVSMVTISVNFGMSKGYSLAAAATILSVYNLANGISRLVTGMISDVIGRNLTLAITFVGAGVAYLILPHSSSLVTISILAGLIGFGYGTLFACSAPLISDCFGIKHFGVILGLVFTAYGFIAGIIGPGISGYVVSANGGNYNGIFYYMAILCLVSAVLVMLVKKPVYGEK
ncbi:MFS transporter [Alkaliphilus transvaalensis]|uniref:MFS transporter n=1 Tax=Alkaliphilus transvaalensis TaxID=114628 RepID=UPI00054D057F|nr:MFS transporter [Alkaliphilus transvaalensis]